METRCLTIFGKAVFATFHHYIMRIPIEDGSYKCDEMELVRVTDRPDEMIEGVYSISLSKRVIRNNRDLCDVFVCTDLKTKDKLGTISVMYNGGNDVEYKIRNIDAFIYNVYTEPEHRGKGVAGSMIRLLLAALSKREISNAYLAVSTNNLPAVRAYEKAGFEIEKESSFIRVLRVNIPYRTI